MTRTPTTTETVASLRPASQALDPSWSGATLERILAAPDAAGDRRAVPVPRRRSSRGVRLGAGALALAVVGGGAAVAGAVTDHDFLRAFESWNTPAPEPDGGLGSRRVDPARAERVAAARGPGATSFTLVAAPGGDGYVCVAALFETSRSVEQSRPTEFVDANGSICDTLPPDAAFGDLEAVDVLRLPRTLGENEVSVVSIAAGAAVRAELVTGDGATQPVRMTAGRLYSWFPGEPGDGAVLTGYDGDGHRVGRVVVGVG